MGAVNLPAGTQIKLVSDADFAPWSFIDRDGNAVGAAVDIAFEACKRADIACEIAATDFQRLLPTLASKTADGIVAGPRLTEEMTAQFAVSRPYFRTLGRFVMRNGTPITGPDVRSLAGLRVGFVENSAHGRFMTQYYARSALTPFKSLTEMLEALRTGQLDAAFGDSVALSFWLKGAQSKSCCTFLGRSFLSKETFSRPVAMILAKDNPLLRERLDAALDRMESDGTTAAILARYLPEGIW